MRSILLAEAAAAFETSQRRRPRPSCSLSRPKDDWPNTFRAARFVPAVEYIQSQSRPTTAMELAAKVFDRWM